MKHNFILHRWHGNPVYICKVCGISAKKAAEIATEADLEGFNSLRARSDPGYFHKEVHLRLTQSKEIITSFNEYMDIVVPCLTDEEFTVKEIIE